ncbi:hypothetical protein CYMTET_25002 [Cymbomonas tetramitiformis]|uniref:Uncharacterized protein n=1 Tax=Cymbomonas tetramitiformis TaxID=36881 RepID=A0AAE0BZ07_9CHLO|nr:hypothetical protein CYMTET_45925 [Cymbomonas tetramitiformis]KAK3266370.1 hypothetical protein CYMTET_25002 [Cymbomonas tetramitiformis]
MIDLVNSLVYDVLTTVIEKESKAAMFFLGTDVVISRRCYPRLLRALSLSLSEPRDWCGTTARLSGDPPRRLASTTTLKESLNPIFYAAVAFDDPGTRAAGDPKTLSDEDADGMRTFALRYLFHDAAQGPFAFRRRRSRVTSSAVNAVSRRAGIPAGT